jgi:hypothetical protein
MSASIWFEPLTRLDHELAGIGRSREGCGGTRNGPLSSKGMETAAEIEMCTPQWLRIVLR